MDQNTAQPGQQELAGAIEQATDFVMQGVGQMHPAFAVAGLIGAIERIAVAGDQHFAMSVAQMVDDCAAGIRSGAIAGGSPQIEVAR